MEISLQAVMYGKSENVMLYIFAKKFFEFIIYFVYATCANLSIQLTISQNQ